jgi:hypothetical protein
LNNEIAVLNEGVWGQWLHTVLFYSKLVRRRHSGHAGVLIAADGLHSSRTRSSFFVSAPQ